MGCTVHRIVGSGRLFIIRRLAHSSVISAQSLRSVYGEYTSGCGEIDGPSSMTTINEQCLYWSYDEANPLYQTRI